MQETRARTRWCNVTSVKDDADHDYSIYTAGTSLSVNIADGDEVRIERARGRLLTIGLGDFNRDGVLDVLDIDLLTLQIDTAIFNADFDVNLDNRLDLMDHTKWIKELKRTWFGDADLDGEFNSSDLVSVFQAGQYDDNFAANSSWSTGDWNGDREFGSSDLVVAFRDGGFEFGPRAVASVPEPSTCVLVFVGLSLLSAYFRCDAK